MAGIEKPGEDFRERLHRARWIPSARSIPAVITVGFGILFAWLVVSLYIGSTVFGIEGQNSITLQRTIKVFTAPDILPILFNTLALGFVGGFISTALGGYLAWVVVRTNAPGRRALRILALAPMAIPFLTAAIGWVGLFSPRIGVVTQWLAEIGYGGLIDLYSLPGIIVVAGLTGISLPYLLIEPALRSLPSSLEEAARASGASVPTIFFKITVPLMIPALASSFLLSSIYLFGNFEYPFIFGTGDIHTFATVIYEVVRGSTFPQYDLATIYSIFYTGSAFIMIFAYRYVTKQGFRFETVGGRSERTVQFDLGKWRYGATLLSLFIIAGALGVPMVGVLGLAFASNTAGFFTNFSLENFVAFVELAGLWSTVETTILLATAGATGVVFFSLFISYTGVKLDVKYITNSSDYIATIPLGFPPIVYGVAVFWFVMLSPVDNLFGTIWPLVLAVMFLKIPHGVRMISSNLIQISDELEDAGRSSGASWFTTFRQIIVPLLKSGLSNAFLFTFIDVAKELAAVVLLVTAGNQVIMGLLLNMWNQNPSTLPLIAAGSVLFTVILAGLTLVQSRLGGHTINTA